MLIMNHRVFIKVFVLFVYNVTLIMLDYLAYMSAHPPVVYGLQVCCWSKLIPFVSWNEVLSAIFYVRWFCFNGFSCLAFWRESL